ncbi:hypothetical protein [Streptomyces sp. NBC_01304]|uniref:hypothetical protein n=1 Tax=Streptomyces sp. NBC_01304 TaxID=2903818 RepID=UPI002E12967F|nr:hypothetical protein OG430_01495 [Streptomyces sp. NBC_01304]
MNEGSAELSRLGTLLGTVAAPTGLVVGLVYYFGYWHQYSFFGYFGISSTTLDITTTDYLVRSMDTLFAPMTVAATGVLLALWGHSLLMVRLTAGAWPWVLRYAVPAVASVAFLAGLGGFVSALTPTFLNQQMVLAPLCLSIGVTVLTYALHLRRALIAAAPTAPAPAEPPDEAPDDASDEPADPANTRDDNPSSRPAARPVWAVLAEWAVVFVLVALGLVWAASDYATQVGTVRAVHYASTLAAEPSAVLYSKDSLSISAPGVRETHCRAPRAAYGYRYDGLILILQSGNQYVLLPRHWTRTNGVALLIPRSNSVRLEFGHSTSPRTAQPTC